MRGLDGAQEAAQLRFGGVAGEMMRASKRGRGGRKQGGRRVHSSFEVVNQS